MSTIVTHSTTTSQVLLTTTVTGGGKLSGGDLGKSRQGGTGFSSGSGLNHEGNGMGRGGFDLVGLMGNASFQLVPLGGNQYVQLPGSLFLIGLIITLIGLVLLFDNRHKT